MVNAADNAFIDRCKNSLGQIISISRCTDLIENDSQRITLLPETNHCLYKIIAIDGVQPCRTNYHSFLAMIHHVLFARQLGRAINRSRTSRFLFRIRNMRCTVKHIIGRNLNHCSAISLSRPCQISRCYIIQFVAKFDIILSLVYRCISSAVHDDVNLMFTHIGINSLFITNVQLLYIRKKIRMLQVFSGKYLHFIAKLPVGSGDQYIHFGIFLVGFTTE